MYHCPFCGKTQYVTEKPYYRDEYYYILCTKCNAKGPAAETAEEAEMRWLDRYIPYCERKSWWQVWR